MNSDDQGGFRDTDERIAAQRPMGHTPGKLEDKETASALANRTNQTDTTSLRPEGAMRGRDASTELQDDEHPHNHRETQPDQQQPERPLQAQPDLGTAADPLR